MIEDTMNIPPNMGAGEVPMQPTEKMVPQSKVDEIVRHAYAKAIEKGRNEAMQAYAPPVQQQQAAPQQQQFGMNGLTPDTLQQMIAEETRKSQEALMGKAREEALREQAAQVAADFYQRIEGGSSKYDDYNDVVGKLPFAQIAPIVQLATSVDNTDEVMYELGKNPMKLATFMQLMSFAPQQASAEMRKLSDSIKSNAEAKRSEMSQEPLHQLKSSPTSTDSGSMSVSDFRKIYK